MTKRWQDGVLDVVLIKSLDDEASAYHKMNEAFYRAHWANDAELPKIRPVRVYTDKGRLVCDYEQWVETRNGVNLKLIKGAKLAKLFDNLKDKMSASNLRDLIDERFSWAKERWVAVIDRHYYPEVYMGMADGALNKMGRGTEIGSCMSYPLRKYTPYVVKGCKETTRYTSGSSHKLHPIAPYGLISRAVLVCSVSDSITDGINSAGQLLEKIRGWEDRRLPFSGRYMYTVGINHGERNAKIYGDFPREIIPEVEREMHRRKFVIGNRDDKVEDFLVYSWQSPDNAKLARMPYIDRVHSYELVEQNVAVEGFSANMNVYRAFREGSDRRGNLTHQYERGETVPR